MLHTLNINGQTVQARSGETLVDAALSGKVLIPHDCATGQCETCRVNIPWGEVDAAGTSYGDTVLACQARVCGDATILFEQPPQAVREPGRLETITPLSDDVVEITVRSREPLAYRPGQYVKLAFEGYPAREYSFSAKMDQDSDPDVNVFQIKRLKAGRVSTALGNAIRPGHRASLHGPFGSAFLREQEEGPLVLTASGTGFAPIWSLAKAAIKTNTKRPISLIAGVRTPADLYMQPALNWLRDHGHDDIKVSARHEAKGEILPGQPDHYLPDLCKRTSVHVAGNPDLVERVREKALAAQAACHADPFTPSSNQLGLMDRIRPLFKPSNLFAKVAASG